MSACTNISHKEYILAVAFNFESPWFAQSLARQASPLKTRQLYLADYNLLKSECFVFIGQLMALPFRLEACHEITSPA